MKKLVAILTSLALIFTLAAWSYRQTDKQTKAHEIAQLAREMGLGEDNPIIVEAQRIWWEEEGNKSPPVEDSSVSLESAGYSDRDAACVMIAKVIYGEARGIASVTEQACVAWTILNRVDAGYGTIEEVVTAPNQFCYRRNAPTVDDYGRDLAALAGDVISRWEREKAGESNIGRVLPAEYLYYWGNGRHNFFTKAYRSRSSTWDYSLESPYEEMG